MSGRIVSRQAQSALTNRTATTVAVDTHHLQLCGIEEMVQERSAPLFSEGFVLRRASGPFTHSGQRACRVRTGAEIRNGGDPASGGCWRAL